MQFIPETWGTWTFSLATARVISIEPKCQGYKTLPCKKAERLKATKPTAWPGKIAGDTKDFSVFCTKIATAVSSVRMCIWKSVYT